MILSWHAVVLAHLSSCREVVQFTSQQVLSCAKEWWRKLICIELNISNILLIIEYNYYKNM